MYSGNLILNSSLLSITKMIRSLHCSFRKTLSLKAHIVHASGTSINTMNKKPKELVENIVWVDMEMTGLDIDKDRVLEIACIVTDSQLNVIAEGPDVIIHQTDEVLNNMNEWCYLQHGETGLTDESRRSNIDVRTAELKVLHFIEPYTIKSKNPIAGNSIYMDRLFIKKHMPGLDEYLHYRNIDVSTVKELCRRWCPNVYSKMPMKELRHRALSDIHESIKELQYYKIHAFKL